MNSKIGCHRGYSLVELLIAMLLSAFLIGGAILIQTSGKSSSLETTRLADIQEGVRFINTTLKREAVKAGFTPTGLLVDQYAEFGPDNESLTLRYQGLSDCNGELVNSGDMGMVENTYMARLNEDRGERELACNDRPMVNGVENVVFQPIFAESCSGGCECPGDCLGARVDVTLSSQARESNRETERVRFTVAFRNVVLGRIFDAKN